MVFFSGVKKKYKAGCSALEDVSFHISKGEFVFLVGSSGAGKSTITKIMTREEVQTSGTAIVNGFNIGYMKQNKIPSLRRSLGMVFQDFRLLPNKTAYDNIAFAMQIIEAPTTKIKSRVLEVLDLVSLSHKKNSYPNQLSGGEQQRIALARALVNKPAILIADEPTGNLDPDTAYDIFKLINQINQNGTTVIVATHAKEVVNFMKKRVIVIEKGKVIRDQEKSVYYHEI